METTATEPTSPEPAADTPEDIDEELRQVKKEYSRTFHPDATKTVCVRLTKPAYAYFEGVAEELGLSCSDAVRVALTYAGMIPLEIRNKKAAMRLRLYEECNKLDRLNQERRLQRIQVRNRLDEVERRKKAAIATPE